MANAQPKAEHNSSRAWLLLLFWFFSKATLFQPEGLGRVEFSLVMFWWNPCSFSLPWTQTLVGLKELSSLSIEWGVPLGPEIRCGSWLLSTRILLIDIHVLLSLCTSSPKNSSNSPSGWVYFHYPLFVDVINERLHDFKRSHRLVRVRQWGSGPITGPQLVHCTLLTKRTLSCPDQERDRGTDLQWASSSQEGPKVATPFMYGLSMLDKWVLVWQWRPARALKLGPGKQRSHCDLCLVGTGGCESGLWFSEEKLWNFEVWRDSLGNQLKSS